MSVVCEGEDFVCLLLVNCGVGIGNWELGIVKGICWVFGIALVLVLVACEVGGREGTDLIHLREEVMYSAQYRFLIPVSILTTATAITTILLHLGSPCPDSTAASTISLSQPLPSTVIIISIMITTTTLFL